MHTFWTLMNQTKLHSLLLKSHLKLRWVMLSRNTYGAVIESVSLLAWGDGCLVPRKKKKKVTVPLSEDKDWDLFIQEYSIIVQSTENSHWESMIDLQLQVSRHSIAPCMSSRTLAGKQTDIHTHTRTKRKEELTDTGNEISESLLWKERVLQTSKVEFKNTCHRVYIMIILLVCQGVIS